MNGDGDFVYDYIINGDGEEIFELYSDGKLPEPETAVPELFCSSREGSARILPDGRIAVSCPRGESFEMVVTEQGSGLSDAVYIRNPSAFSRFVLQAMQRLEQLQRAEWRQLRIAALAGTLYNRLSG